MKTGLRRAVGTMAMMLLAANPVSLQACAACFGQSDDPMARGMNMGIFTLLIVILSVLIGIAAFFAYILRRASRLAATAEAFSDTSVSSVERVSPQSSP